ncbi:MAG: NAD(P)/FAD-dependent oxidoreductase [Dongiaceae bacterium]
MNPDDLFTAGFKSEPYWWKDAPRPHIGAAALPKEIDVLVIGAGYTGLMAARETALGGRSTLAIDAESAGWGCSSRNGGQVSTSIKPSFSALSGRHNEQMAFAIRKEGIAALDYIDDLIRRERLDCDWRRVGRYHAAHNRRQYDKLAAFASNQPRGLEVPIEMVPRAEQHREIASDLYHGGAIYALPGALHPAKYHLELLRIARAAGAQVVDQCAAQAIERDGAKFRVRTGKGTIVARDVVLATNGYSGPLSPWHRRRVIPIGSYLIATAPESPERMRALIPHDRMVSDTRRVVFYYRLSPDHRSILFGGRVAYLETNPLVSAPRLHRCLTAIFPSLKETPISHSWMGFVAYTFDTLPHVGQQDGIYYAMGYCGSGVSLATYFGMRVGQQVLGRTEGKTALDNVPFQTRPLYTGNPWFLAPSVWWYRLLDALPI